MILTLEWVTRDAAQEPAGVVAAGAVAKRLVARLQEHDEEALQRLSAVATRDMLVVLGAADALPWSDGVRYCAPEAAAPGVWLPTHAAPRVSPDLLRAALEKRLEQSPVLLWNAPEHILPLDQPVVLTHAVLAWLARELD